MSTTVQTQRIRIGIAALERRMNLHRTTIWRKCRTGELVAPHYIGNRRAWWLDEIETWETAQMARPPSARPGAANLLGAKPPAAP